MKTLDLQGNLTFDSCDYRVFYFGERHINRCWEKSVLLLVYKNSLIFEEDGRRVQVDAGNWYIQRDNLLQRGTEGSPAPEYFYVHFDGLYQDVSLPSLLNMPIEGTFDVEKFKPIMRDLFETQRGDTKVRILEDTVFRYLVMKLTKEFMESKNGLPFQVRRYIQENYAQSLPLHMLSEKFGYCSDYLEKVFRVQFGISIHQYIIRMRNHKAKQLMMTSDLSIDEISQKIGYTSSSLLYKAFIKQEGISPMQWRQNVMASSRIYAEKHPDFL